MAKVYPDNFGNNFRKVIPRDLSSPLLKIRNFRSSSIPCIAFHRNLSRAWYCHNPYKYISIWSLKFHQNRIPCFYRYAYRILACILRILSLSPSHIQTDRNHIRSKVPVKFISGVMFWYEASNWVGTTSTHQISKMVWKLWISIFPIFIFFDIQHTPPICILLRFIIRFDSQT